MIIPFVIVIIICLCTVNYSKNSDVYQDYLSIESTNTIKGVFILFVLLNHISNRIGLNSSHLLINEIYCWLFSTFILQAVVSMFFFYSGYSVMLCIDTRGVKYLKEFPKKRILKTVVNAQLVLLLYLILNLLFKNDLSIKRCLLSFVFWDDLGYSLWYIFVIVFLYFVTYISFSFCKSNYKIAISAVVLFSVLYFLVLRVTEAKYSNWYDTVLIYSLGMIFYHVKDVVEKLLDKKQRYLIALLSLTIPYLLFAMNNSLYSKLIKYLLFSLIIVLLSMKFKVNNKFLEYCGKNLFYIYMLQGVVFLVLDHFNMNDNHILYGLLAVIGTFAFIYPVSKAVEFIRVKTIKV